MANVSINLNVSSDPILKHIGGGVSWNGPTTCVAGYQCVVLNDYYSQCVPSSSFPTTTSAASTTIATSTAGATTTVPASPASTGFVTTSGQRFMLDGEGYPLVGWVPMHPLTHKCDTRMTPLVQCERILGRLDGIQRGGHESVIC